VVAEAGYICGSFLHILTVCIVSCVLQVKCQGVFSVCCSVWYRSCCATLLWSNVNLA